MGLRGDRGAPYWAVVHLIRVAWAFRAHINGRLLTLGITDSSEIAGPDFFDLIEYLIADEMAKGGTAASKKLREVIASQVSLTPDRATWGMNADDPAWQQDVALPAPPASAS